MLRVLASSYQVSACSMQTTINEVFGAAPSLRPATTSRTYLSTGWGILIFPALVPVTCISEIISVFTMIPDAICRSMYMGVKAGLIQSQ